MTEIVQHTTSTADKMEQARLLADASLIPAAYKKNPANVFVAIEYGEALGIHPMVALSEINVIQGTPSLSASLMASLARNAGHKVRVTGDATHARCVIVRADDPDFEYVSEWDVAKAKAAGLWGKGHWAKDPGTMLRWRSISEGVRFACSEVLGGLKYTPDEVLEFTRPTPVQAPAPETPSQPTTIRRKPAEDITVEEVTDPAPEPISEEQWATLNDWMDHHEMQDKRDFMQTRTGRDLVSPMELTADEASAMIEELSRA